MDKVNVKIKGFKDPGTGRFMAATPKFFIRDGGEMSKGCRALEPGEVVTLDVEEARHLLAIRGDIIEMTLEAANRPLHYSNEDEAYMTSQYYNPNTAGRAEEAKQLMAQIAADLAEKEAAEGGKTEPSEPIDPPEPDPLEAQLDEELADYEPTNNAHHIKEIEEAREKAAEEEQPRRRRRRS